MRDGTQAVPYEIMDYSGRGRPMCLPFPLSIIAYYWTQERALLYYPVLCFAAKSAKRRNDERIQASYFCLH